MKDPNMESLHRDRVKFTSSYPCFVGQYQFICWPIYH